jgi:3-oxoadipate enol-lactonase
VGGARRRHHSVTETRETRETRETYEPRELQGTDTMTREDDFDRGLKNRRAVLGDAWVDKSTAGANGFNAEFQSFITRFAWNDIWGRPGLDPTTRRLLVLGMTMGLARWEEFELHCAAAVRASQQGGGITLDHIKETLMQGAIYCGVPAANTGFKIFIDVLKAQGIALDPAPLTEGVRVSTHHTFSVPQLQIALQGDQRGEECGNARGVPVVLSHALGLDLHMWDGLAGELAADRPVLRYDHRGHGGSATPAGPYTMDELVDDAARVVREWGCGPVAWVGLSMGGMVGQGLAIRHPELVCALVLANTTSGYPAAALANWAQRIQAVETGGMAAVAEMVIERYLHEGFRATQPQSVARYRGTILRCDPKGYAANCHAVAHVDWLDRLGEIKAPTLIIAGTLDVGAPPAMSQAMHAAITGSRLVVLAGASHLSVAEQPTEFSTLVRGFLEQLGC